MTVAFMAQASEEDIHPWQRYELNFDETLVALFDQGLALPMGARIGPLKPVAHPVRAASLARPWTMPPPLPSILADPTRRKSVIEGVGIEALRTLVVPPPMPTLGSDTAWPDLFAKLGTRLPNDYLEVISTYGGGIWRDTVRFPTPLDEDKYGLGPWILEYLDDYRAARKRDSDIFPLTVWPEAGGFLPFANTVDGDTIGWLTEGDPDEWPMIVDPRYDDQGPPLPTGLVDTLLAWMRGQLDITAFPGLDEDDDPLDFASFEPWDEI